MLWLLLVLLVAIVVAALYARTARRGADLPEDARVVGADLGSGAPLTLRDVEGGLVGCPDVLLERSGRWVLIEKKRASRGWRLGTSYHSHRLQVGAYLLMCEADPRVRTMPEAWIHYVDGDGRLLPGGSVQVPATASLLNEVRDIVGRIRRDTSTAEVHRSHGLPGRCRGCGVREACGEALVERSAHGSS
jgi:CRISPR-associated exonuclease Cas4